MAYDLRFRAYDDDDRQGDAIADVHPEARSAFMAMATDVRAGLFDLPAVVAYAKDRRAFMLNNPPYEEDSHPAWKRQCDEIERRIVEAIDPCYLRMEVEVAVNEHLIIEFWFEQEPPGDESEGLVEVWCYHVAIGKIVG